MYKRQVLDDINGIGPARRKALMRHFKEIEAIREADVETLLAAPQMNRKAAEAVYEFFHSNKPADSAGGSKSRPDESAASQPRDDKEEKL